MTAEQLSIGCALGIVGRQAVVRLKSETMKIPFFRSRATRFAIIGTAICSIYLSAPAHSIPLIPAPADPLTANIDVEDVERFARTFAANHEKLSAGQLQKDYLDHASYGVSVFTPDRIIDASHLAKAVARDPAAYERAIRECLPRVQDATADLRSIYLALHGLLPNENLPQIYIVFGAGTSGGTAGPNAQVLGLEVLCANSPNPEVFKATLRRFFAHETVHTFQHEPASARQSPLLAEALTEGSADFIAALVTGETPEPSRASWAAPRERELWTEFQKDMLATQPAVSEISPASANKALHRWVENYQEAPPGWPFELGYWIGMRIWQSYYTAAKDKHQAIRDMLEWNDAELILRTSGYVGGGPSSP